MPPARLAKCAAQFVNILHLQPQPALRQIDGEEAAEFTIGPEARAVGSTVT
jgi:hypothetical protein